MCLGYWSKQSNYPESTLQQDTKAVSYTHLDVYKRQVTPAYKQYKEFMQTYINALKVIYSALGIDQNDDEESPYRKWLQSRTKKE